MGNWTMFPDLAEQKCILESDPEEFVKEQLKTPFGISIVVSAAYDLYYGANIPDKSGALIKELVKDIPIKDIVDKITETISFRIFVDGASAQDQSDFIEFCQSILKTDTPSFVKDEVNAMVSRVKNLVTKQ